MNVTLNAKLNDKGKQVSQGSVSYGTIFTLGVKETNERNIYEHETIKMFHTEYETFI